MAILKYPSDFPLNFSYLCLVLGVLTVAHVLFIPAQEPFTASEPGAKPHIT